MHGAVCKGCAVCWDRFLKAWFSKLVLLLVTASAVSDSVIVLALECLIL
jgi:hypothetical protein